MYAGVLRVDHDTVCDILQAADLLLMESVRSACIRFLQQTISAENCVTVRQLGRIYACPGIGTWTFWLTIEHSELRKTVFGSMYKYGSLHLEPNFYLRKKPKKFSFRRQI